MDGFKWIQTYFVLVAVLQLTAVSGQYSIFYNVRAGDDVTFTCGNKDQSNCNRTTWTWTSRLTNALEELIKLGQVVENSGFQSDRLSVTADCSLVIKKVRKEDAGLFVCQQLKSEIETPPDDLVYLVFLSVVSMTEQKKGDEAMLTCTVSPFDDCRQTVRWLIKDVKDHQGVGTSNSPCSVSVTLPTYHEIYTSRHQSLECKVSVGDNVQLFPFRLQASEENPGEVTTDSATRPTEKNKTTTDATESGGNDPSKLKAQWRLIVVSVGLSALILTVVTVNVWARTKGKQTRVDDNMVIEDHDGDDDDAVNYENVRPSAV